MKKVVFLLLVVALIVLPFSAYAQGEKDFSIYAQFTGLVIGTEDKVDLDVKLINTGKVPENVKLTLVKDPRAKNWDVMLLSSEWDGFGVNSIHLGTKKPDNVVSFKFHIKPAKNATPGVYKFVIKGITSDGSISKELPFTVRLRGGKVAKEKKTKESLKLTSKYPTMQNPAGSKFSFEVNVKNKSSKSRVVEFSMIVPEGWNSYITPKWEEEKKIDSMKMDADGSETVMFTVIPPELVKRGSYPVKLIARAGKQKAEIKLTAVVTGTYKLKMIPETRRLNFDMIAGKEKHLILYLWNEGSASITNVSLFASKPNGWEVKFKPDKIAVVEPYAKVQKPTKVDVTFKAPERTIPGDYMVSVSAVGKQSRTSMDLRVTVNVPTTWGWIGVAVIIIVLLILVGIFIRLKRR